MKMKTHKGYLRALLLSGLMIPGMMNAQINLNGVKNTGSKVINNSKENKENSNSSTSTTSGDESGYDLYMKGNEAYDAGNYKLALEYYQKAEAAGFRDGQMTMRMRECEANMDPNAEQEAEDLQKYGDEQMNLLDQMKYKKEPVPDQGMINELHKANVGKIVFSKSEIVKSETSSANWTNTFNMGDDIYSRIYLSRSMTNEAYSIGTFVQNNFRYRITIDGNKQTTDVAAGGNYLISGDEEVYNSWTTFQIGISPKKEDVEYYPAYEVYVMFSKLWKLPAGKHTVKIEAVFDIPEDDVRGGGNDYLYTTKFGPERVIAEGEFTINITEEGKLIAGRKLCKSYDWINYKTPQVPDAFSMVSKAANPDEKVIKVVLLHNDWTYNRNYYGVILSREIAGRAIYQDVNTKLCYLVDLTFYQENISSGGSSYGATTFSRTGRLEEYNGFILDCVQ